MPTTEEVQQLREIVLQEAQLEAVTQELPTQQTASAQAEVRSRMSLVHTKLLTKPNMFSDEHDGKEP